MTQNKKKIFAICGSTKNNSSNESILRHIAAVYDNRLDVEIYTGIIDLPQFSPDLDYENAPVINSVKTFREQIEKADGVIICTPEYVFSLPGTLKNALDWTVSTVVFSDKPTAIIIASASGKKARESLELIMRTLGAKMGEKSKLLISGVKSKVNREGQITDEATITQLQELVDSLWDTINA